MPSFFRLVECSCTQTLHPLIWLARRWIISSVSADTPSPSPAWWYALRASNAAGTTKTGWVIRASMDRSPCHVDLVLFVKQVTDREGGT